MSKNDLVHVFTRILRDVQIKLKDEFDRNFERQGFFSERWARRRSPLRPGRATLVDTGGLRRSVQSKITSGGVTFYSAHPAADIHNEGGEIKVTARMKRYFWARHYAAVGGFGRKKNGELRGDKRTRQKRNDHRTQQLSSEASFWKFMALMKVGSSIKISRRQFLGASAEVEKAVTEIIEQNLEEYFNNEFKLKK